jgi:hypothetical protein
MQMLRNSLKLMSAGLIAFALFGCDVNDNNGGTSLPSVTGPADSTLPGSTSKLLTSLNFGTNILDTLTAGGVDWYRIRVQKDSVYRVSGIGAFNAATSTNTDTKITILSSSSVSELASNDDIGTSSDPSVAFKAPDTGYVRIKIEGGKATSAGVYQLRVVQLDRWEPDDSLKAAIPLTTDSVFTRHTLPGGDVDWSVMRTIPGQSYEVFCTSSSPYMYFYDSKGNTLSKASISGYTGMAYSVVAIDTLTWVKINAYSSTSSTVSYGLAAIKGAVDAYEPDDAFAKATLLPTDSTVQKHLMNSIDEDAFKLNVQAGKVYKISILSSISLDGNVYEDDTTYNSSLSSWYVSSSSYTPSVFTIEPTYTGVFYFSLDPYSTSSSPGSYTIAATTVKGDSLEPDNGISKAVAVTVGASAIQRTLTTSDVDWFKFTADSGKFYTVSYPTNFLSSVATSFLTADSAYVPSSLTSLSSYTGGTFACIKSGTYYFRVSSSYSGTYSVSLASTTVVPSWYFGPDAYEPDNKLSTASILKADSSVAKHNIVYGDEDWTKIAVDSGKTYVFNVKNTGSYTCYFYLYSADSAVITSSTTAYYGETMSSTYTARRSTDVYVRLTSSSSSATSYQLSVQPVPTDTFESDNGLSTAKTLPADGTVQSRILFGTEDWIKVHLDSAKSYQIRMENRGTSASFYNEIYSPDSAMILSYTSVSTGGTNIRTYKPSKATDIYVRVYNSYLSTYVTPYTILVRPEPTDTFETDNGLSSAKPIVANETAQYHLMSGTDQDWVSIQIDSGFTYTVSAKSISGDYLSLYVYTADSAAVGSTTYSTAPSVTAIGRRKTTYFAKVTSYYTSVTTPFGYEINVKAVAPVALVVPSLNP